MTKKRFALIGLLGFALAFTASAQRPAQFAGTYWARSFAYGINQNVAALQVGVGTTAAGAGSIVLNFGNIVTPDNVTFMPLATNAPILIGTGANAETVTPTAVSCRTPATYQSCVVTATFANVHGVGDNVMSGTAGLQEAINFAFSQGGGLVELDLSWQQLGGTNAMITAAAPYSSVVIDDNRGGSAMYWSTQPTTATTLAAPTTLTAVTAVWSATPVGTWTAADHFVCITYVDALGGEGPCSATYDFTPAATTTLTITSPAASTGAVGWRAYAAASYATAYLLPITSTNCTLTTLESVFPACAIGSNGVFTNIFVNTAIQKPAANPPVATSVNPPKQGHTLFGYVPTASLPLPFQNHFGPFNAMSGGTTAGQVAYLGSFELPTGYLAYLGRTLRITGRIYGGTVNTATTPSVLVKIAWAGGTTTGAPVALCTATSTVAYGASTNFNHTFTCRLTVTTVAAGAASAITTDMQASLNNVAGTTASSAFGDLTTAAVGSLNLALQNTIYVEYIGATNATASLQLLDLHVETLQ